MAYVIFLIIKDSTFSIKNHCCPVKLIKPKKIEAVLKVIQNYYQLTNCKCIPFSFGLKAQLNSAQGNALGK